MSDPPKNKKGNQMAMTILSSGDDRLLKGAEKLAIGMTIHVLAFNDGAPYNDGVVNDEFTIADIETNGPETIVHLQETKEVTLVWDSIAQSWDYYGDYPNSESLSCLTVQVALASEMVAVA